jgi:hypothetical protein
LNSSALPATSPGRPLAWPVGVPLSTLAAAAAPLAIGAIVTARTADASPVLALPGIALGVVVATGPALYIVSAAIGAAPPLAAMARAFGVALRAFGVVLCGLVLPVTFVSLSATEPGTAVVACSAAIAAAALCALVRLSRELQPATALAQLIYAGWAIATLGIAARLWWDVAVEVLQ